MPSCADALQERLSIDMAWGQLPSWSMPLHGASSLHWACCRRKRHSSDVQVLLPQGWGHLTHLNDGLCWNSALEDEQRLRGMSIQPNAGSARHVKCYDCRDMLFTPFIRRTVTRKTPARP